MPEWYDILTENWRLRLQQFLLVFNLKRPWAPVLCAGLAFGASFIQSTVIRVATTGVAIILFLIAAAEVARYLVEEDHGPSNPLRPSRRVPITLFQVILVGVMAAIYTFLILGALQPLVSILVRPSLWTIVVTIPAIFLIACLVAWRNVRLWSYEAEEYGDRYTEQQNELAEKERLKKMRLPSSYWDHPQG
ncbi:MAG TPA: hypothetical protein VFF39_14455 [Verrucomicrobiae bacterium]|nr:hypothetical protein [Verrucomicrobiae bacterium]